VMSFLSSCSILILLFLMGILGFCLHSFWEHAIQHYSVIY
jgi:hypothetical protein